VVVQADELGEHTSTVLVCPMSSEIETAPRLRPTVEPSDRNGIRVTSQMMADKVTALQRDRIRRVIGHLDPESHEALDRALMVALGLTR
jgi:mRNA interferase MazF